MEIHKTVINQDGSYTIQYCDTFVDLNGVSYTVLVQTKTRFRAELQTEIDSFEKRIALDTYNLSLLQTEMESVLKAGG